MTVSTPKEEVLSKLLMGKLAQEEALKLNIPHPSQSYGVTIYTVSTALYLSLFRG